MPAHWFYNINNIAKVFNGGIRNYVDPPHPHLESFMVGMGDYHRHLYYFFGPYIGISLMVAKKDVEFCENILITLHMPFFRAD